MSVGLVLFAGFEDKLLTLSLVCGFRKEVRRKKVTRKGNVPVMSY